MPCWPPRPARSALRSQRCGRGQAAVSAGPLAAAGTLPEKHKWGQYSGERLSRVAFPMGGMGAGMICLEGTGALSHVSLRNKPEVFQRAVHLRGHLGEGLARTSPACSKARCRAGSSSASRTRATARAARRSACRGFARPASACGSPSARSRSRDKDVPLEVEITGWSPFEPGDADDASLPRGRAGVPLHEHARPRRSRPCSPGTPRTSWRSAATPTRCEPTPGGFVLWGGPGKDKPCEEGAFSATVERSGREGQPRLVPRRLVRSADDGLERHRRRGLLRSAAGDRRRTVARRHALRAADACPRRVEDDRAALGVVRRARRISATGKDPQAAGRRPRRARTVPGTRAGSRTSTK